MGKQFLFIFEDIKNTLFYFLINLLQLVVGMLICCMVLATVYEFNAVKRKINEVGSDTEIYMLRNQSTDEQFEKVINDEKCLKELQKLYQEVQNLINTSEENTDIYIADSGMRFSFSDGTELPEELVDGDTKNGIHSKRLSVTENFFSIYQLQGTYSHKVLEEFRCVEGKPTPLILGDGFRNVYKEQDEIEDVHGNKFVVVGFLDRSSYYVAPNQTRELLSLDNYVIMPHEVNVEDSVDITMYLEALYIMAENDSVPGKIVDRSKELGLYDLSLTNFSHQLDAIISDTNDEIFINTTFLVIILIFSFVGITGNFLQFIANYKREFAIHLLCGANMFQIIFRICMQMFLMVGIGLIIVFLVFGMSKAYITTMLFVFLFMGLVLIYPFITFMKQTIHMMLRRSYE